MNKSTENKINEMFVDLRKEIDKAQEKWTTNNKINSELLQIIMMLFDLAEEVDVDLEVEMQRANNIVNYVQTRMLEDIEI